MTVEFLQAYGEYAIGDVADVADEVANALCAGEAPIAKPAEASAPADEEKTKKVLKTFENSVEKKLDGLKKDFKKEITDDVVKAVEKKLTTFKIDAEAKNDDGKYGFKSLGDMAASVFMAAHDNENHINRMETYRQKTREIRRKASYLNTSDDSVFVPHAFGDDLWNASPDYPKFFNQGLEFKTESLNFDAPFIDDTSRSSEGVGGFTLGWTAEYNQSSLTKPATNKSQMKLKKLTGLFQLTEEVKRTPYNIGTVVDRVAAPAFINKLNSARLFGAGSTEPIGQLTSGNGNLYTITRAVANLVTLPDILAMDAASNDMVSGANFVWLYSPSVETSLYSMKFPNNAGSVPAMMPVGQANGYNAVFGKGKSILGKDAFKCVNMKKLGFKGDIALVNLNNYYLLRPHNGPDVQVDTSIHLLFDRATDTIRWITWYDAAPCQTSYQTLSDGSTIVSDAIVLSTYT